MIGSRMHWTGWALQGTHGFTPSVLSGLVLWLRADRGVTIPTSNHVSVWADQSGSGNDVTQPTDLLRHFFIADAGNGKPGIGAGPNNAALVNAAFTVAQPNTIIAVYRVPSSVTRTSVVYDGTTSRQSWQVATATSVVNYAGVVRGPSVPNMAGRTIIHITQFQGASSWTRMNGLQYDAGDLGAFALTGLAVGSRTVGNTQIEGYLQELLVINRVLTPSEIANVEGYYNAQYSVPFSPAHIANMVGWFRADDVVLDGSSLAQTSNDRSGLGRNLTQATTGSRPPISTLGTRAAFNFDGVDDFLASAVFTSTPQPFTVVYRAKWAGTGSVGGQRVGDFSFNRYFNSVNSTGLAYQINAGVVANIPFASLPGGSATGDYVWSVILSGASSIARCNGAQVFSGNLGTVGMDQFSLGASAGGGSPFVGLITEMIAYSRALTVTELQALETYLASPLSTLLAAPESLIAVPGAGVAPHPELHSARTKSRGRGKRSR